MGKPAHTKQEKARLELERIAQNPSLADQYTEDEIEELELLASGED